MYKEFLSRNPKGRIAQYKKSFISPRHEGLWRQQRKVRGQLHAEAVGAYYDKESCLLDLAWI